MRVTMSGWQQRCVRILLVFVGSFWCMVVPVQAQFPPDINNPSAVQFIASADHGSIDSYELDILRPDGSVLQTLNLGKPTPDASNVCTAPINVQPVTFANGYTVRVRAKSGTALSDYALSENKFNRVPGSPTKVVVK